MSTDSLVRSAQADRWPEGEWDAVIIGCGPAGGMAALLCSRLGLKTLLVDKQRFPRHKVCGCCLNRRAMDVLKRTDVRDPLMSLAPVPLDNVLICLHDRTLTVPLPDTWAVSRAALDQTIAEAAVSAGCQFVTEVQASVIADAERDTLGRGKSPADKGYRTVQLTRGGIERMVQARVVLICDGLGHPSLAGHAAFQPVVKRGSRVGVGSVLPAQSVKFRDSVLDHPSRITMVVTRNGYAGIAPLEDGRLNLAAALDPAYLRSCENPATAIRTLLTEVGIELLSGTDDAPFRGTRPLTQESRRVSGHRLLILGDAAGYVEPFTGEGIAWALRSAELAAPLVQRAIAEGWRQEHAELWTEVLRTQVASARMTCRILARCLQTPWLLSPMLTLCQRFPSISRCIVDRINSLDSAGKAA